MQDESADVVCVFDGVDVGGQWLSGYSELLCLEFDSDQSEQESSVVGG